jgi:glucose-6-phosphate isomerase
MKSKGSFHTTLIRKQAPTQYAFTAPDNVEFKGFSSMCILGTSQA